MADNLEDRIGLAENIDIELLQHLARLPRRQQRAVLLLLMAVENLLYEMLRDRRTREEISFD